MKANTKMLSEFNTYVFIDVSNIRSCCLMTLGWKPNFKKLSSYLARKYPSLREMRYYEGIASGDYKKDTEFKRLKQAGYMVCPLERKSYTDEVEFSGRITCKHCKARQSVHIVKPITKFKSNVDVYLATEFLKVAYLASEPTHLVLMSCDGDYAEMIKSALDQNENVYISVIATPVIRSGRNTCSTRLQALRKYSQRFHLIDIRDIEKYVRT